MSHFNVERKVYCGKCKSKMRKAYDYHGYKCGQCSHVVGIIDIEARILDSENFEVIENDVWVDDGRPFEKNRKIYL